MREKTIKKIEIAFIMVVLVGSLFIVNRLMNKPTLVGGNNINVTIVVDSESNEIKVEEGMSLMEIMEENYEIQTQYDGTFISGINDMVGNDDYFVAFYINEEMAMVGANEYIPKDGDNIKFELTEIIK